MVVHLRLTKNDFYTCHRSRHNLRNFVPSLVVVVVFVCQEHQHTIFAIRANEFAEMKRRRERHADNVWCAGNWSVCEWLEVGVCVSVCGNYERCLRRANGWRYLPQHMCSFVIIWKIHTFFGVIDCPANMHQTPTPTAHLHRRTQRKWENAIYGLVSECEMCEHSWGFNVNSIW